MKKLILTTLSAWLCLVSIAQPPQPVTIVKSTDEKTLEQTILVEIRNNKGEVVKKITWKKGFGGKSTREEEDLTPGGKTICKTTIEFDENMKMLTHKSTRHGTFTLMDNGDMWNGENNRNKKDLKYYDRNALKYVAKKYQNELKSIEENEPIINAKKTACSQMPGGSCQPKAQLFAGYSFLNADFGTKRESFPLGALASLVVNLSPRIGVGPDISIHTKKIGDQTITRMFFLAKGQYNFVRKIDNNDSGYTPELLSNTPEFSSNSCPSVIPDFHVYIGYSTERSVIKIGNNNNTSSGGGFTFGAGIGVQFKLSKSLGLGIQADYLGTKFKNNDEINSDIRGSAGLLFNLGNAVHEMKYGR